jgi:uncharacterized protein (TIGR02996 family)
MTDLRDSFVAAMRARPDDLVTPLVYADWLEEHGDADRAAFVRKQCRGEDTLADVVARHKALCQRMGVPDGYDFAVEMSFSRGFVESLKLPVQWLIDGADALADEPLLRQLTVGRVNGWGARLAELPLLEKITDLEIEAWISPADARAISVSPHLRNLRTLEVWLGGDVERTDLPVLIPFCVGAWRNYRDLTELRIVDVPGCTAERIAEANTMTRRPIAKAVIPLPRLYPIASHFSTWLLAGHLPDGTQVLADVEADPTVCRLFCFTPEGAQTGIREVAMSPDTPGEFEEYLSDEFGFEPGLIRVLDIDDPEGPYSIEPDSGFTENFGVADDPNVRPEDEPDSDLAMGRASYCSYWLKYGAYVFSAGNSWYVGPHGEVEST